MLSMKTTENTEFTEGERDPLTAKVIGCAIEVHRTLGPGLLESAYEQCLAHELRLAQVPFRIQVPMPVEYKGVTLDCGYRIDLLVHEFLVVELKAVEQVLGIHQAQLLTYMKLAEAPVGLLINFGSKSMDVRRVVLSQT